MASTALAAEPSGSGAGPITPPVELRYDWHVDVPATVALGGAVVVTTLVQNDLAPSGCRWCDGAPGHVDAVDDWFRTAFRRPDTQPAEVLSNVVAYGVAPVALVGATVLASTADRRGDGTLVDLHIALEGVLSAMLVTQALKPIISRERPYAHAIVDETAHAEALTNADALRSFPSGHTSSVFAMAAATGMVATMRGYRLAPLVWAAGIMLGAVTAYARMAADKHYFTDTLGGAAIGTVVGGGVPYLFHRPIAGATFTSWAVPGGRLVGASWQL